jgi:F0F1-type ATP synthase assembly protein I
MREMKKAADSTTKESSDPNSLSLGAIALDLLDTAWRIAVPVLLFAVAGLLCDKHFGTKPWLTLLGMAVGFAGAGLLVKSQLATINRKDTK